MVVERTEDTGDLGEELRAVAIKSEPRWSALLWPQETNWRNNLGLLFPELLELCYIVELRSLAGVGGGGEAVRGRSKGGGGHLAIQSVDLPVAPALSC